MMHKAVKPIGIFGFYCLLLCAHIWQAKYIRRKVLLTSVFIFFHNIANCFTNFLAIHINALGILSHKVRYSVLARQKRCIESNMSDNIKSIYVLKVFNGSNERNVYALVFNVRNKLLALPWVNPDSS